MLLGMLLDHNQDHKRLGKLYMLLMLVVVDKLLDLDLEPGDL